MANQTVYPYGTDGSLPVSVGIVNDLTTGGADKALSAEMGKELSETLDERTTVSGGVNSVYLPLIYWEYSINGSNNVVSVTGYNYGYVDVTSYRGKTLTVDPLDGSDGAFFFLDELPSLNTTVSYTMQYLSAVIPETASVAMMYLRTTTTRYYPKKVYVADTNTTSSRLKNDRTWEQGTISNQGSNVSVTTAIRTPSNAFRVLTDDVIANGFLFQAPDDTYDYKIKGEFYKLGTHAPSFVSNSETAFYDMNDGIPASVIPSSAHFVRFVIIRQISETSQTFDSSDLSTTEIYEKLSVSSSSAQYINDYIENLPGIIDEGIANNSFTRAKFMQWNIGHFSLGVSKNSAITSSTYVEKLAAFRSLINTESPDFISLSEYSAVFGKDTSENNQNAKDVLFQNFKKMYIGSQHNYSCNALFSNINLSNIQSNDYECNQEATITHTDAVLATDYYYLTANWTVGGKTIKVVSTHLAFDANNSEVAQDQIEELITLYADEPYVIMLGDWNTTTFSLFESAGYTQANGSYGYLGSLITYPNGSTALDNIVCKGVYMSNIKVVTTELSDHYALVCDITI